jgi:ABC-type branched-subunit amino acid transport system ATPase component
MSGVLQISGVTKRFGGLVAVNDVSFDISEGEIVSVIGPNGAGKSTLFKVISSFLKPTAGEVRFRGERISGLAPHVVARRGVVRTFQETTIFKSMTVRENVVIAHHLRSRASLAGFFLHGATKPSSAGRRTRSWSFLALRRSPRRLRAHCRMVSCGRSASRSGSQRTRRSCFSTSPSLE